jgi:hypothetical protein
VTRLILRIATLATIFVSLVALGQSATSPFVDEKDYVGNVHGTVVDAETGKGLTGVRIVLLEADIQRAPRGARNRISIQTNKGDLALPADWQDSEIATVTDEKGEFLISGVPTPSGEKHYSIIAIRPDYGMQILRSVRILPGAVMALEVSLKMKRYGDKTLVFDELDSAAPFRYRHEQNIDSATSLGIQSSAPTGNAFAGSYSVFATTEGLVGMKTANGHVIVPNDRFVALPSGRALSSRNGNEFQVRLTNGIRTVVAPVWDVGPWNIHDDYWSPPSVREMWKDLRQGLPEAQAAYQNKYNGGKDDQGRKILNPAGIDLADGTAADIGSKGGSWITVELIQAPDTTPPTVGSLTANPTSMLLGGTTNIQFAISDSGGSGLNRAELWRATFSGTQCLNWTYLYSNSYSGNGPLTVNMSDSPRPAGTYCYGTHVFDNAKNQRNEPAPVRVVVTPPDTTPPSVGNLSASSSSIRLGGSVTIQFTISDSGGSGLDRAELWRSPDNGGRPGNWTNVQTNRYSGNGPLTASFADSPPSPGGFSYGTHVFDKAGNQRNEPSPIKITVTVQDTIPPTVGSLNASPGTIRVGTATTIQFTISDSGGSGLNRVELWRAPDINGRPGSWTNVQTNRYSGNGPLTAVFRDNPSVVGGYWYGTHVFDGAGNQRNEPGIIKVTVTK